ncbi:hypothetical protein MMC30_008916 [Trapelia coarctata]|nr:hypothetical protein [Trapelia coarctata]
MASITRPQFNIIIVGAGIAGLCAGIGLAQQGHNVTIVESAHELAPIGIGIHIPPNATLALNHFGLLDKLEKDAFYPTSFFFRRWEDSSTIAEFPASKPTQKGAMPYWSMRRSHYQRNLYEAAVEAGCKVRLGSRVETMDVDTPSVTLTGGETLNADIVVIANGIKSTLRNLVIPEHEVSMVLNPMSSYRVYVTKSNLLSDPVTAPLFEKTATNVWLGYAHHAIVYPCGGDLYTIGATHPTSSDGHEAMEWTASAEVAQAVQEFKDYDSILRHILALAEDVKKWRLAEVPRLPRWTSESGKVVLVGDSAHAMLQFLAQGAAMATEDAVALAVCVERARSAEDIPGVLHAFERSRKWRCEVVQAQSRRNGDVIHMPDGEEQENRDKKMAGLPQDGIWEADMGPFVDGKFRTWLYEHSVVEHARKVLDSLGL